jgi:hypothetical protein
MSCGRVLVSYGLLWQVQLLLSLLRAPAAAVTVFVGSSLDPLLGYCRFFFVPACLGAVLVLYVQGVGVTGWPAIVGAVCWWLW